MSTTEIDRSPLAPPREDKVEPNGPAFASRDQIVELVREFESTTLPKPRWTHSAHLTVALWNLLGYPIDTAIVRIRERINRYNAANGILPSPTGGYHETITLFWIKAVDRYLEQSRSHESLVELANGLIRELGDKNLLFSYYSRDRLFSNAARQAWVEPDLTPL